MAHGLRAHPESQVTPLCSLPVDQHLVNGQSQLSGNLGNGAQLKTDGSREEENGYWGKLALSGKKKVFVLCHGFENAL